MGYTVARLTEAELPEFREFCETNWGEKHPLIHNETAFCYYYRRDGLINFVRARDDDTGEFLSVGGFIFANDTPSPDVWLSFILTKKGAPLNLGFQIIEKINELSNSRTFGVNNIRKKTCGLYEFLGYKTGAMTHYYRLNPERAGDYRLCTVQNPVYLPIKQHDTEFIKIENKEALDCFGFENYSELRPYKDRRYVEHRFFENPWLRYEVYGAAQGGVLFALLVLRAFEYEGRLVLRLVDYIGDRERLYAAGELLDRLARERNADFSDLYAFGIDDSVLEEAGFIKRLDKDENIIPDYLLPPLYENIDFYSVANGDGYWIFRADGDQDRPNPATM